MNKNLLVAFIATIIPLLLIGAEPSAFGAGDLNNPNPYGLTSGEEVILQNKKNLRKIVVKSKNQENEVDSLRERLDGLQTIVEGLSQKAHKNRLELKTLDKRNSKEFANSNEYEKRLSEITQSNSDINQKNSQSIEEIKLVVSELSTLVSTISDTVNNISKVHVTKDELNVLVNDVNKFKDLVAKELKKAEVKKSNLNNMSNDKVAKKARAFYDKKNYTKSIEYYNHLIGKGYKPARSHYMVGEMYYYRRNYADAIAYFKKSASLYSKASYMPVLMLHTAVSMSKTGDKKNAKSFYLGIIAKYPNSKYAKDSKKFLEAME